MIKETKPQCPPAPYEELPLPSRKSSLMKLNRNTAFLMLLMVCLASIHNQQLPNGKTVLTAVQQTLDSPWQEDLGKITFVDNLIPESLSVFFTQPADHSFSLPCSGSMVHAWQAEAPYVSFLPHTPAALCMADGEVMNVSHTSEGTLSLRIRHDNGTESVYYHLAEVFCREGDAVKEGDTVASIQEGENLLVDVRRDGLSIDPAFKDQTL